MVDYLLSVTVMLRPRRLSDMVRMQAGKEAVQIIGKAMEIPDLQFHTTVRNSGSICYCCVLTSKSQHRKLFMKCCKGQGAKEMFEGEVASINALRSTQAVNVPKAIQLVDFPDDGVAMVMEYAEIGTISEEQCTLLGEQVARLHLHNAEMRRKAEKSASYIGKAHSHKYIDRFGFDTTTYHGFFPQNTSWTDDWLTFYTRKLEGQMQLLEKHLLCSGEIREMWSRLVPKLPLFFKGIEIQPSLLHGDLWYGNVAGSRDGPVIYDPASFYGHSEYEIAYSMLCPEFPKSYYDSYFKLVPKAEGFEKRVTLYQFYTAMNEWNHFGKGGDEIYRKTLLECLNKCVNMKLK